ncbi:MAG: type II toxin-antitoxin system VapC family toxin [Burkholderiaceae bacterium]|jgi:tRNA(fMet)-specific endonuclease VapC|nr:type II toxin-antitoxin system VapC family toxin [Burkholderiaceae bacterium]
MPVPRLLDTNICIYIARNRPPTVARRFARAAPGSLGISIITWGELCFGAAKSTDPVRAHGLLDAFAREVAVLELPAAAGRHYGGIRAALQKAGTPIGNNDLWIAAHALALGVPLVSNNAREFERVPGLKLENWV